MPAEIPGSDRNLSLKAVLLAKYESGEKDVVLKFLTERDDVISVKDRGAAKGGLKSFPMFSAGTIFVYRNPARGSYTLRDSSVEILRPEALKVSLFLKLQPFVALCVGFSPYCVEGLYSAFNSVLDSATAGCDVRRLFVCFSEFLFRSSASSPLAYAVCPVCSAEYADGDTVGYSSEIASPVCSRCGDGDIFVLPGMRRYLRYIAGLDIPSAASVAVNDATVRRLLDYERGRLRLHGRNVGEMMRVFDSDVPE